MYNYNALVLRWIDGDSFEARIDTGFHIHYQSVFRLAGVNTPEKGQPGFEEAKLAAYRAAPHGSTVPVTTYKPDKYGRWLADIHLPSGETLTTLLIREGLGVPYKG